MTAGVCQVVQDNATITRFSTCCKVKGPRSQQKHGVVLLSVTYRISNFIYLTYCSLWRTDSSIAQPTIRRRLLCYYYFLGWNVVAAFIRGRKRNTHKPDICRAGPPLLPGVHSLYLYKCTLYMYVSLCVGQFSAWLSRFDDWRTDGAEAHFGRFSRGQSLFLPSY